ncbi:phosphate ABC transporter substrate-binding protein PstS [Rodentibacter haemolyticus]|nr:phosphate ABC transporter substrate-binding protein PstS [Rodentibacter haemolyticus]
MKKMRYIALTLLSAFAVSQAAQAKTTVTGAGASFPQPIYVQWAMNYKTETGNQVNYQSIGSSGGIKQIISRTVDFGASDSPMKEEDLTKNNLIQFPTVIGGVVPVVNVEGIGPGQLKLTGEILADIYLGKITHWNDGKIRALNPDLNLPDARITTVFRADGSGTSFIFTHYLSQISADWKEKVGAANTVKWPTSANGAAGKGNEGVSIYVGRVKNSIGYVEYAYAKQNKMSYVQLKNSAGHFVQPSQESFAAAANVDWDKAKGFSLVLTNQPGEQAWPLAAATFILIPKESADKQKMETVLNFFDWAYSKGNEQAAKLDYVPLPDKVKNLVRKEWEKTNLR